MFCQWKRVPNHALDSPRSEVELCERRSARKHIEVEERRIRFDQVIDVNVEHLDDVAIGDDMPRPSEEAGAPLFGGSAGRRVLQDNGDHRVPRVGLELVLAGDWRPWVLEDPVAEREARSLEVERYRPCLVARAARPCESDGMSPDSAGGNAPVWSRDIAAPSSPISRAPVSVPPPSGWSHSSSAGEGQPAAWKRKPIVATSSIEVRFTIEPPQSGTSRLNWSRRP